MGYGDDADVECSEDNDYEGNVDDDDDDGDENDDELFVRK